MIVTANQFQLHGMWAQVAVGLPLTSSQCERLAKNFIAANLVLDLAWFFSHVIDVPLPPGGGGFAGRNQ